MPFNFHYDIITYKIWTTRAHIYQPIYKEFLRDLGMENKMNKQNNIDKRLVDDFSDKKASDEAKNITNRNPLKEEKKKDCRDNCMHCGYHCIFLKK